MLKTETAFGIDTTNSGVDILRKQLLIPGTLKVTYDYKRNINKQINDVFAVTAPSLFPVGKTSFNASVLHVGDWNKEDVSWVDLGVSYNSDQFACDLNFGQGMGRMQKPQSYFFGRLRFSDLVTTEGGFLSTPGYTKFSELTQDKYFWIALNPKHFFIALGNQVKTTWALAGTKEIKNFGSFSFLSVDRQSKDYWFRSQNAYGTINEGFFSQENYVLGTSTLVCPPFLFVHFSPLSTKGTYAFKVDGKKVGTVEKWEVSVSRQFGPLGHLAIGAQRELGKKNGIILEYYNSYAIGMYKISSELRYESISQRFTGYITMHYQL